MRRYASSSMGAFHPTLFLVLIYAIAISLSFFVGRMIFNSINDSSSMKNNLVDKTEQATVLN